MFANHFLFKSSLTPREREILILRVGRLCGAEYEWTQHVPFAERAGLSAAEIRGIVSGATDPIWTDESDRNLIRAANQLHRAQSCLCADCMAGMRLLRFPIRRIRRPRPAQCDPESATVGEGIHHSTDTCNRRDETVGDW